jgi:hypothetical protein
MPFKSEKQRRFLHANEPEVAKSWEKKEKMSKQKRTAKQMRSKTGSGTIGSAVGGS